MKSSLLRTCAISLIFVATSCRSGGSNQTSAVLESGTVNEEAAYLTKDKPVLAGGEREITHNRDFLSCEKLKWSACNANGEEGVRLCYVKIPDEQKFIVTKNKFDSSLNDYLGNNCMSSARINKFTCDRFADPTQLPRMICIVNAKYKPQD